MGNKIFKVAGVVTKIPGGGGLTSTLAPAVYISLSSLDSTGLVQFGSRVGYSLYIKAPSDAATNALIDSKAIDNKRKRFYEETIETNRGKPANTYVFGDALRDAATYHSYCSIVHAFAETEEALTKRDDLEAAFRGMKNVTRSLDYGPLSIAKDFTLTIRSIENAKKRKAELVPKINQLLVDANTTKGNVGAKTPINELLLAGVENIDNSANQSKAKLEELAGPLYEKDANDIADSLRDLFDKWSNSSPGEGRDSLAKRLDAKHSEATLLESKVREGISSVSAKLQEASAKLQAIQSPRTLTLTNNISATARVKSNDGWLCDITTCGDRKYPDSFEVTLSVEAKTAGSPVTAKWSASCPDGKVTLTANVACTVEQKQ